jgi:hypothetical protein
MQNAGWANRQWAPLYIELLLAHDVFTVYVSLHLLRSPLRQGFT